MKKVVLCIFLFIVVFSAVGMLSPITAGLKEEGTDLGTCGQDGKKNYKSGYYPLIGVLSEGDGPATFFGKCLVAGQAYRVTVERAKAKKEKVTEKNEKGEEVTYEKFMEKDGNIQYGSYEVEKKECFVPEVGIASDKEENEKWKEDFDKFADENKYLLGNCARIGTACRYTIEWSESLVKGKTACRLGEIPIIGAKWTNDGCGKSCTAEHKVGISSLVTDHPLTVYTPFGPVDPEPTKFIVQFVFFATGLGIIVALFQIISGGLKIMTSTGNPEAINQGKETLESAVLGLLFIIFAVALLQAIGVNILQLRGF